MSKRKKSKKKEYVSPSYKKYDLYIIRHKSGRFYADAPTLREAEELASYSGRGNKVVFRNNKKGEKFIYSD